VKLNLIRVRINSPSLYESVASQKGRCSRLVCRDRAMAKGAKWSAARHQTGVIRTKCERTQSSRFVNMYMPFSALRITGCGYRKTLSLLSKATQVFRECARVYWLISLYILGVDESASPHFHRVL